QQFSAKLAGQAILPANTMVPAPADSPEFLKHSGKFTTPDRKRTEALGTIPGKDGAGEITRVAALEHDRERGDLVGVGKEEVLDDFSLVAGPVE
ncbi:hypothetical protein ACC718_38230, partial [Rhizobium ruizarguesonis]